MHAVFFGIKRVHLEVVHRVARRVLRGSGLTAARFDLMRVVVLRPGARQGSIRWLLGVSAPTVSRMLKSLEEMGLVERELDEDDRRCVVVRATAAGIKAVEAALAATVKNREVERVVARCALGDTMNARRRGDDETVAYVQEAREKVEVLASVVAAARRALFDKAPYHHPWRSGSLLPVMLTTLVDGQIRYGDESLISEEWVAG